MKLLPLALLWVLPLSAGCTPEPIPSNQSNAVEPDVPLVFGNAVPMEPRSGAMRLGRWEGTIAYRARGGGRGLQSDESPQPSARCLREDWLSQNVDPFENPYRQRGGACRYTKFSVQDGHLAWTTVCQREGDDRTETEASGTVTDQSYRVTVVETTIGRFSGPAGEIRDERDYDLRWAGSCRGDEAGEF